MLASDLNNPEFSNPSDPDARLHVVIYKKPIKNDFRTQAEGRPIFEDQVFIRIQVPGDSLSVIDTPLREDHKMRWPKHWAYFESTQGKEALEVGTPLNQWPLLGPAQVEELRALKFTTVEQVAGASDLHISKIGMAGGMAPLTLREKAQRFLLVAHDVSVVDHAKEELEAMKAAQAEKDAKHEADMAAMRDKMDALLAMVAPQKKRGRPPKQAQQEQEAA